MECRKRSSAPWVCDYSHKITIVPFSSTDNGPKPSRRKVPALTTGLVAEMWTVRVANISSLFLYVHVWIHMNHMFLFSSPASSYYPLTQHVLKALDFVLQCLRQRKSKRKYESARRKISLEDKILFFIPLWGKDQHVFNCSQDSVFRWQHGSPYIYLESVRIMEI